MYNHRPNTGFDIEAFIQRHDRAVTSLEYNCHLRRLYPWAGIANTKRPVSEFGAVWVTIDPQTHADEHEHDEEETFLMITGKAHFYLEGQSTELRPGDVAYVPRYWRHQMCNTGEDPVVFIDIYWDDLGRTKDEYFATVS